MYEEILYFSGEFWLIQLSVWKGFETQKCMLRCQWVFFYTPSRAEEKVDPWTRQTISLLITCCDGTFSPTHPHLPPSLSLLDLLVLNHSDS